MSRTSVPERGVIARGLALLGLAIFLAPLLLLALPSVAVQVPAGAEIDLRLKTKVSSGTSKPGDPIEAMIIAPVMVEGRYIIPGGALMRGQVRATKPAQASERAELTLDFTELDAGEGKRKITSRVLVVDNARETVTEEGRITGILASETLSARMDQGIGKVAGKYAGLADILGAVKGAVLKPADAEISYEPGVELRIRLNEPLDMEPVSGAEPRFEPISSEGDLTKLVVHQPFRTVAENPPKPSDITNLMFIGTEEQVSETFQSAGWATTAAMSAQSKLETFRAIAELRGYKEAPMSVLLLDNRPPDLVFQKQNNTFAQRHHLRIWRRPDTFGGQPVWVCAATHDTGIKFSPENRTFIHKIDPLIDRERSKVVNDFVLTGRVRSFALVDRPEVPKSSHNATGDELNSEGKMAVLILK
jgi:hypothetical protein